MENYQKCPWNAFRMCDVHSNEGIFHQTQLLTHTGKSCSWFTPLNLVKSSRQVQGIDDHKEPAEVVKYDKIYAFI